MWIRAFADQLRSGDQVGEFTLIVVADFLDRERVFTLAQQQELVGAHPHDFVRRGEPPGGDVRADAFRVAGAIFTPADPPLRADGIIFQRRVADRFRQQLGRRVVVDPERLDHARVGHEGVSCRHNLR